MVENTARWPFRMKGPEVVSARAYLTDPKYAELRTATVFNLCRAYGYQSLGYYVSLLAAARGHRPLPSVATLQDLRLAPLIRIVSEDLDADLQRILRPLRSSRFDLSIYFGRNVARRYDSLSQSLFDQFPAPFLRALFVREAGRWKLQTLRPIATAEIPDAHQEFVMKRAREYFARPRRPRGPRRTYRYDLAILYDPESEEPPSDPRAISKFMGAAREVGIDPVLIERDDYRAIAEFDGLFIRETTYVDHYTYRMSRRAAAEGLVVIDDPESIVRCTNKVFQAELFARRGIPSPETMIVHRGNVDDVVARLDLPCVLKRPDSSFSDGVVKPSTAEEVRAVIEGFLDRSELLVAQRFVPSEYDWRVGVLGGRAIYACKYHMARGHWQIVASDEQGRRRYGRVEAVAASEAPAEAIAIAERSAALIGAGLYGVDVKESDGRFLVMEVNDNPSIDSGYEDAVLGDELYLTVMRWFRERLDARGTADARP